MKEKTKGFISGFVIFLLISLFAISVFADPIRRSIEVTYNDINLVVDGQSVHFGQDSAGNKIEPFIYNGTTYLPVRAVGEALGKNVSWDRQTQTVYVGLKPNELNNMTEIITPYKNHHSTIYNLNDSKSFDMGGKSYSNGYTMGNYNDRYLLFNLDGQFNEITGVLGAVRWRNINGNRNFNIYLDGKLYKSIEVKNSELPQEISIPVSGVMQLKLESPYTSGSHGETFIGFGNVMIE